MRLEQRNKKYLVVDENDKILLMTTNKNIAKNFLTQQQK
jgi:hypothetical protein